MRTTKRTAACMTVGVSLLLTGCVTEAQNAAVRQSLKGNPGLRPGMIDQCVRNNRSTAEEKRLLEELMNLKPGADVIRTACVRIYEAVASGRITYRDVVQAMSGSPSVEAVRVLQAR